MWVPRAVGACHQTSAPGRATGGHKRGTQASLGVSICGPVCLGSHFYAAPAAESDILALAGSCGCARAPLQQPKRTSARLRREDTRFDHGFIRPLLDRFVTARPPTPKQVIAAAVAAAEAPASKVQRTSRVKECLVVVVLLVLSPLHSIHMCRRAWRGRVTRSVTCSRGPREVVTSLAKRKCCFRNVGALACANGAGCTAGGGSQ